MGLDVIMSDSLKKRLPPPLSRNSIIAAAFIMTFSAGILNTVTMISYMNIGTTAVTGSLLQTGETKIFKLCYCCE